MPTVHFEGRSIACPEGANLRMVLVRARLPLYRSAARALNCRGHGTCGTCAVRVEGPVSEPTKAELRRDALPPHPLRAGMRLACQCSVLGDVRVARGEGIFGRIEN